MQDEYDDDLFQESKRNSETLEKIRRKKDLQVQGFTKAIMQFKIITAFQNLHDSYLSRKLLLEEKKLKIQELITKRKKLKREK